MLYRLAYYFKLGSLQHGNESPFWDFLIFKKIRAQVGGRLRLIVAGGAPLSPHTQDFMRVNFGMCIQGFGCTETAGAATVNSWDDCSNGNVGAPCASMEYKLVSCPEMDASVDAKDANGNPAPRGEIYLHGANVAKGYFLAPDKTKEDFPVDEQGNRWFATGDIGIILPTGNLKIIDRKKDLVKLKAGEYVAIGSLESSFKTSAYVENICVIAKGDATKVVAVIQPSDALLKYAKNNRIAGSREEVVVNKQVIDIVKAEFKRVAAEKKISPWEVPADVYITADMWTPENGYLTAAMKLKRKAVNDAYKVQIDKMLEPFH